MTRVNLTIDKDALSAAQRKAALAGIDPTIAGNASAFVRWLVDEFNGRVEWRDAAKELPPDESAEYLVYDGEYMWVEIWEEKFEGYGWGRWGDWLGGCDEIKAWMPLPKPPIF